MPYPALPASRRRHFEIDGSILGWNLDGGFGTGMTTVASSATAAALNNEGSSSSKLNVVGNGNHTGYFFVLFPETVDLSFFFTRFLGLDGNSFFSNLQGSVNTTNGADGTWVAITTSGTLISGNGATDWWRSLTPASLTANNTGLVGIRFQMQQQGINGNSNYTNLLLWGTKHAGVTPDDIIFLESDNSTEWPTDDDFGDVIGASPAVTHTCYVKNTSALTAHTITVKSSGSDSAQWTVSLDNVSFGASQTISSLAAGASQAVYYKLTPPAAVGGNLRPYAAYIEADVASWS